MAGLEIGGGASMPGLPIFSTTFMAAKQDGGRTCVPVQLNDETSSPCNVSCSYASTLRLDR